MKKAQNSTAAAKPASSLPVARLPLPGFELESIGLRGRWEEEEGSYFLPVRPGVEAKGVLHFLGGAFIGAAPHLGYKYFLEALSDEGYAVICTPYNLSFSYVDVCAGLVARSEGALRRAQEDYGDLPLIGVGHSCGALLHTLLPCFFPSYKPVASVLISYNNKPASESIPSFEELVVPVSNALLDSSETATQLRDNLARAVSEARERADAFAASALAPSSLAKEVLPISRQGLKVVEQLPDLLLEIKEGRREYTPNTQEVAELLNAEFKVPASLIVQFEDDTLDESDKLAGILASGDADEEEESKVSRAIKVESLDGSHITPLTQDVFISTPFDSFDPLLPIRRFARQESLRQVEGLLSKVLPFLEQHTS